MKRRAPSLLAATVLVAVVASSCADAVQSAIEVNGEDMSRTEFVELVEKLGSDEGLRLNQGWPLPEAGRYSTDPLASAVGLFVQEVLVTELLDSNGGSVTAADREEAREQLAELGPELRGLVAPMLAPVVAFQRLLGEDESIDGDAAVNEAYADADVRLDPRYGSWTARGWARPGT